jgi:hypothetical protein
VSRLVKTRASSISNKETTFNRKEISHAANILGRTLNIYDAFGSAAQIDFTCYLLVRKTSD